jgi:hypothetical protein
VLVSGVISKVVVTFSSCFSKVERPFYQVVVVRYVFGRYGPFDPQVRMSLCIVGGLLDIGSSSVQKIIHDYFFFSSALFAATSAIWLRRHSKEIGFSLEQKPIVKRIVLSISEIV